MASVPCPFKLCVHSTSSFKRLGSYKQCNSSSLKIQSNTNSHIRNSVNYIKISHIAPLNATMNNTPKGFGPKKTKKPKPRKQTNQEEEEDDDDDDDDDDEEDDRERGVIPEIVTNRMISRMGFTVGIPLFIGLMFFPFFYYLKVGLKVDVPTWVPFIVSFVFFGTALGGVSYGIVSSSWDPLREGSLLGWNEAKKNWPVFWQSFRGSSNKR